MTRSRTTPTLLGAGCAGGGLQRMRVRRLLARVIERFVRPAGHRPCIDSRPRRTGVRSLERAIGQVCGVVVARAYGSLPVRNHRTNPMIPAMLRLSSARDSSSLSFHIPNICRIVLSSVGRCVRGAHRSIAVLHVPHSRGGIEGRGKFRDPRAASTHAPEAAPPLSSSRPGGHRSTVRPHNSDFGTAQ